jgi:hypothetical protein
LRKNASPRASLPATARLGVGIRKFRPLGAIVDPEQKADNRGGYAESNRNYRRISSMAAMPTSSKKMAQSHVSQLLSGRAEIGSPTARDRLAGVVKDENAHQGHASGHVKQAVDHFRSSSYFFELLAMRSRAAGSSLSHFELLAVRQTVKSVVGLTLP